MSSHHRRTLEAVFRDPVSATIVWADVEAMLVHYGAEIREGKGSRVRIELNGRRANFHRPHPRKEASRASILKVRTFIEQAELKADDEIQGIHGIRRIRPG
jgi:hypothetical protein